MQTVGNYLRQEREAKNISLGEVAQLTKISEFYLDFLEKDDYEKLPQGPYIKGYISSYARLIGSNADEAIKLYNSLQEQMNQIEAAQAEQPEAAAKPAPIASLQEKIGSSIKALSASIKAKTASPKIGTSLSE
ncbi:MAG: helix-turn-helix domain-containing protein, partial [Desulfobacterales bacterium]|nr:helix-turn-helix domain-containing protein [Desulfobacterales bacterium]